MPIEKLHIICFDIPDPPSYGGAIDVFYCIKALAQTGVCITLHCFYKGKLRASQELEKICEKVYYYPRKTSVIQQLHWLPYGVVSRTHPDLLPHLLQDDSPILFEGLVSCALMNHPFLRNRKKYFRECNVEHDYYHALGRATTSWWKKLYLHVEAERLRWFEHNIRYAKAIFTLSHEDDHYFRTSYPHVQSVYVPCFHGHKTIVPPTKAASAYILYHGNLAVAENNKAAMYIIQNIAPQLSHPIIFAGKKPTAALQQEAQKQANITLISSPDELTMQQLIRNARVHLLITFQGTGIKLKLLNVLYTQGHVVVNPQMVVGTDLSDVCHIGTTDEELVQWCKTLICQPTMPEEMATRLTKLQDSYNDDKSAHIMRQIIFKS